MGKESRERRAAGPFSAHAQRPHWGAQGLAFGQAVPGGGATAGGASGVIGPQWPAMAPATKREEGVSNSVGGSLVKVERVGGVEASKVEQF